MRKDQQRYKDCILRALGEAIRIKRLSLALSQEELGAKANLHRTYITDIENGQRNLSFMTLLKVCAALDLQLSILISEAENIEGWHLQESK